MFQSDLLKGKRVLITGGGTGLGKSMGRRMIELGAELMICGRRAQVLEDTAKETQAYVYATAQKDEDDLLGKLKAGGLAVNTPNKDAFVAASKPVYDDFAKEVAGSKEVIDRAIALGK